MSAGTRARAIAILAALAVGGLGIWPTFGGPTALAAATVKKKDTDRAKKPAPKPPLPNRADAASLAKVTLITLNNAVTTGNFAVLRARSALAFRKAFSAAKLRRQFAGFVKQRVDLSTIAGLAPVWSEGPAIDGAGRLRLRGRFNTAPRLVRFDIGYVWERGAWRLTHIAVDTTEPAKE